MAAWDPLATADLFEKIICCTRASRDQDHLRVLIDSNTNIPDRTAALLHGGQDPTPHLVESARLLERAGAQVLVMPCNTAHNFYDGVAAAVQIPVLHMIRITAQVLPGPGASARRACWPPTAPSRPGPIRRSSTAPASTC